MRHFNASLTPLSGHTCVLNFVTIKREIYPTVHSDTAVLAAFGIGAGFAESFSFEIEVYAPSNARKC